MSSSRIHEQMKSRIGFLTGAREVTVKQLVQLEFAHNYEIDLLDELPSSSIIEEVRYFPSDKRAGRDGVLLRVRPSNGESWCGMFACGSERSEGFSGVFSCPSPQVCRDERRMLRQMGPPGVLPGSPQGPHGADSGPFRAHLVPRRALTPPAWIPAMAFSGP